MSSQCSTSPFDLKGNIRSCKCLLDRSKAVIEFHLRMVSSWEDFTLKMRAYPYHVKWFLFRIKLLWQQWAMNCPIRIFSY